MENIYVFRVVERFNNYNHELLEQQIVLLTCVQDVELYREYLIKQHENERTVEVTVSRLEDNLEPSDEVQQRLLSI